MQLFHYMQSCFGSTVFELHEGKPALLKYLPKFSPNRVQSPESRVQSCRCQLSAFDVKLTLIGGELIYQFGFWHLMIGEVAFDNVSFSPWFLPNQTKHSNSNPAVSTQQAPTKRQLSLWNKYKWPIVCFIVLGTFCLLFENKLYFNNSDYRFFTASCYYTLYLLPNLQNYE